MAYIAPEMVYEERLFIPMNIGASTLFAPVPVQVNDLIIVCLFTDSGQFPSSVTWTPEESGWNSEFKIQGDYISTINSCIMEVWTKRSDTNGYINANIRTDALFPYPSFPNSRQSIRVYRNVKNFIVNSHKSSSALLSYTPSGPTIPSSYSDAYIIAVKIGQGANLTDLSYLNPATSTPEWSIGYGGGSFSPTGNGAVTGQVYPSMKPGPPPYPTLTGMGRSVDFPLGIAMQWLSFIVFMKGKATGGWRWGAV